MGETRHALCLDEGGFITVEELPMPKPGRGEVIVEVHASAVSPGSGLGKAGEKRRSGSKPGGEKKPFGYQNAGKVIALGDGVDRALLGQRLACMGGGYAQHAGHACVPVNLAVPIPEGVSDEEAAFNHLGATALNAVQRGRIRLGENVVVYGLGVVGQLSAQIARAAGARVMAVDKFESRRKTAEACGIELVVDPDKSDPVEMAAAFSRGYGMDCGIICFGGEASEAFDAIFRMLKCAPDTHRYGRIVIVGGAVVTHKYASGLGNADVISAARTGPGYHDENYERGSGYPPVFVEWTTRRNMEEVLLMIREKKLNVRRLITDEYPLDQAHEGCDKLIFSPEEALGVVFKPQHD